MLHIKSIIPRVINRIKNGDIDKSTICKEAEKIIKKNTPDIEVFFYKNKTLYIRCFNSITANELFLRQEELKEEINGFLNKKLVNKLVIKTR
jgi:hypothetical protein